MTNALAMETWKSLFSVCCIANHSFLRIQIMHFVSNYNVFPFIFKVLLVVAIYCGYRMCVCVCVAKYSRNGIKEAEKEAAENLIELQLI